MRAVLAYTVKSIACLGLLAATLVALVLNYAYVSGDHTDRAEMRQALNNQMKLIGLASGERQIASVPPSSLSKKLLKKTASANAESDSVSAATAALPRTSASLGAGPRLQVSHKELPPFQSDVKVD